MSVEFIDFDKCLDLVAGRLTKNRDELAAGMRRQLKTLNPEGWVVMECIDATSTLFGDRAAVPYGGKASMKEPPIGPVRASGALWRPEYAMLASSVTMTYKVPTSNDIDVDEVELPIGILVRHGDEVVLSGKDVSGKYHESFRGRVAAIDRNSLAIWERLSDGSDDVPPVDFPFHTIETAAIFKRHWEDPDGAQEETCRESKRKGMKQPHLF